MNHKLIEVLVESGGMTNSEARVYLVLLKFSESKVGKIISECGLQSSVVHNSISSLIRKGLVSHVLKNKVKHYSALDPENVEQLILSKKDNFSKIIPELKSLVVKEDEGFSRVEVFSGKKGMSGASLKLFEDAKKGDLHKYFGLAPELLTEDIIEFFEILDSRRKAAGIVVKGISKLENKERLQKYKSSELKFTDIEIPPAMSICGDKVLFGTFGSEFFAVLIESKELAEQYHKLWDSVWKNCKK